MFKFLKKKRAKKPVTMTIFCIAHRAPDSLDIVKGVDFTDIENLNFSDAAPLAYVTTEEEAYEYCRKYFFLKHYSHFKLWCRCHDKNILSTNDWEEYVETILENYDEDNNLNEPDEPLAVYKLNFTAEEFAAVLRLASYSLPVGGSWESPAELPYIQEAIKNDPNMDPEYELICSSLSQFIKDAQQIGTTDASSSKRSKHSKKSENVEDTTENASEKDDDDFDIDIFA